MVKKSKLDEFVKRNGYNFVKYNKRKKRWTGISNASRKTGIARMTIYRILEDYPDPPDKTVPKYVQTFEESEGYRQLILMYQKRLAKRSWNQTKSTVLEAWKFLGGTSQDKKDPISWTEDDFRQLWNYEKFHDKLAGGLEEHYGTGLRRLMRAIDRFDLLEKFKSKKRPAGLKSQWFLQDEDIIRLIGHVQSPDVLLFIYRGICEGARSSALLETKVESIDFHDNIIQVFESKTKQVVLKYPPSRLFKLLDRYVKDLNLNPDDPLFSASYSYYCTEMSKAGKKAGLRKNVTTHILKHTFVTQAHRHGVSAETVVDQTGTEFRTLVKYYRAKDEKKIRHEMQGTEYSHVPFYEWVNNLAPYFEARYNELIKDIRTLRDNEKFDG